MKKYTILVLTFIFLVASYLFFIRSSSDEMKPGTDLYFNDQSI